MRYGGATVIVRGSVEQGTGREDKTGWLLFRATGTNQRFHLRAGPTGQDLEALPRGQVLRVTGRVVKGSKGNDQEICLELERAESDEPAH